MTRAKTVRQASWRRCPNSTPIAREDRELLAGCRPRSDDAPSELGEKVRERVTGIGPA